MLYYESTQGNQDNMANILIAEDDTLTRQMLARSLGTYDYQVTVVTNGREAIQQIVACLPDVLVLDLMMPGIDGAMVIQTLRADALFAAVKIIVLTASPQPETIPETAQADLVLLKPLPIDDLVQHIRRCIA